MDLELRHLRHALGLAEHLNFARAADALHITQPALSRSLQALEESLGVRLFDRGRQGVEPTEFGRLLLGHAGKLELAARDLERDIRLAKGLEVGALNVGVGPYAGAGLAGPAIGRLNRLHPQLRINLVIGPWNELPDRARARDIDLLVGEISEIREQRDFEVLPLSPHPAFVVCRPAHPLTRMASATIVDLLQFPLAGPDLPPQVESAFFAAIPKQLREQRQKQGLMTIRCDSTPALKEIVRESDAVSILSAYMVASDVREGKLAVVPSIRLGVGGRFGIAWLRMRTLSRSAEVLVALLQAYDREALALDRAVVESLPRGGARRKR